MFVVGHNTTFVLLSAVCLNLPASVFTPQGDRVIRSPPLAHLSSCSTTPPEKDCRSWEKKENNINRQEATTSNVHHLLAQSLLYHHYSLRNHTRLICFFLLCVPPQTSTSLFSLYLNALCCITLYPVHCILLHSIIPTPTFSPLATVKSIATQSHLFNLSSQSRVGFRDAAAHRREGVS